MVWCCLPIFDLKLNGVFMCRFVKLFMLGLGFLMVGCGDKQEAAKGTLSGIVTVQGKAITGGTIFAKAGEEEFSGFINPQGEYRIEGLPLGEIQLKIVAVPPPPPGVEVNPVPVSAGQGIPLENQNYSKSLVFRYEGGDQKFDIVLPLKK